MSRSVFSDAPADVRDLAASFDAAPAGRRRTFFVDDPASGARIATLPDATAEDARAAVDAAEVAGSGWARTPPRVRSEILHRAFALMLDDMERLAGLIALENGKSLADARAELTYAAEFFRWYAEEAVRTDGTYGESPSGGSRTIVTTRPVGIAALVTPWNFPAAMATRKIAPALAAGCTVVIKPAAETPLTTLAAADKLREAGLPEGVLTVVPSTQPSDVVGAWLADSRVRKLSFTGSTGIGRHLLAQASERIVSSSMELGGNAPFVVSRDADIEAAVAGAMVAKFRNGGQACTAANRFLVHEEVAAEFTARFGAAIEALKVGSAFEPETQIGPLISQRAVAGVEAWVERARQAGGKVSHRALAPNKPGTFYAPTLLVDVPLDATVMHDEIFGPVAPVATWRHDTELLTAINETELGLAAYVYSGDLRWALALSERMEVGMVGINRGVVSDPSAPFGGMKQSGLGREGAREGLRAYQETQYFSVDWPDL